MAAYGKVKSGFGIRHVSASITRANSKATRATQPPDPPTYNSNMWRQMLLSKTELACMRTLEL